MPNDFQHFVSFFKIYNFLRSGGGVGVTGGKNKKKGAGGRADYAFCRFFVSIVSKLQRESEGERDRERESL